MRPRTIQFPGEMILLGTGTSVGVPSIGCDCPVCTGGDPKNQRTRCSAILGLPQGNLLIDTSPDLRQQLLREGIGIVHSVIYTHEHADHIFGLDDLRLFQFYLGHPVPIHCSDIVEARLRKSFDYAFTNLPQTHAGAVPQLAVHRLDGRPVEILGTEIIPIPLKHGPRFEVYGFRFGRVAYCTDCNEIPESSLPLLEGLDVLILDGLRHRPHATHFTVEQAVEVARLVGAHQTYLTHLACDLDYHATNRALPDNIALAYDGLRIPLS